MATIMTIPQIKEEIKRQKFKHVSLYDPNEQQLIAYNPGNVSVLERLKEIETRLTSKTLPAGTYYIDAKRSLRGTAIPDRYAIVKRTGARQEAAPGTTQTIIMSEPAASQSLEFANIDEYKRLLRENMEMSVEIDILTNQLNAAHEKIADLESEMLSDPQPSGWDIAKTFLSDLYTTAMPALDKILEQRDRNLTIRESQIAMQAMQLQGIPNPRKNRQPGTQQQPQQTDPGKEFIEAYHHANGQDEVFDQLVDCYNTASGLNDFLVKIAQIEVMDENEQPITMADMYNQYYSNEG